MSMIEVRRTSGGWSWRVEVERVGWPLGLRGYAPTAEHALRDAWTWCGPSTPALIYTGGARG